jgi:hypothetical protein
MLRCVEQQQDDSVNDNVGGRLSLYLLPFTFIKHHFLKMYEGVEI